MLNTNAISSSISDAMRAHNRGDHDKAMKCMMEALKESLTAFEKIDRELRAIRARVK